MSIYDTLNEQQREAVYCTDGAFDPCGSGIGKDESADAQDCIFNRRKGCESMEYPSDHVYEQGGRGDAGACG